MPKKSEKKSVEDYCKQGHSLVAKGKYKEAEDAFWQATQLDPKHAEAWFNFGLMCYCQGSEKAMVEARREWERLVRQEK